MIVSANAPDWGAKDKDFSDLTAVPVVRSWVSDKGQVMVEFAGTLTAAQQQAVKRRLLSGSATDETLRTTIAASNPTDLAGALAQIKRLARLINGDTD